MESSLLSQSITVVKKDLDIKSITSFNKKFDNDNDLLRVLLNTETDEQQKYTKKLKQNNRSDVDKYAKLLNKIYNYIHITKCCHLFSLA